MSDHNRRFLKRLAVPVVLAVVGVVLAVIGASAS